MEITEWVPPEMTSVESLQLFNDREDHCVYLLISCREVQYVGRSKCLPVRISQHRNDKKHFSYVLFIRCGPKFVEDLEQALIRYYRPPLNGPRVRSLCPFHRKVLASIGMKDLKIRKIHSMNTDRKSLKREFVEEGTG